MEALSQGSKICFKSLGKPPRKLKSSISYCFANSRFFLATSGGSFSSSEFSDSASLFLAPADFFLRILLPTEDVLIEFCERNDCVLAMLAMGRLRVMGDLLSWFFTVPDFCTLFRKDSSPIDFFPSLSEFSSSSSIVPVFLVYSLSGESAATPLFAKLTPF